MKKLIAIISISLLMLLAACSGEVNDKDQPTVTKEELSQDEAMDYLEDITHHLVMATLEKDGSFEQKSSLNAAIGRSESLTEEIREKYLESPLSEEIFQIANKVELGAEKGLNGDFHSLEILLSMVIEDVKEISDEYLNNELPITIKVLEGK